MNNLAIWLKAARSTDTVIYHQYIRHMGSRMNCRVTKFWERRSIHSGVLCHVFTLALQLHLTVKRFLYFIFYILYFCIYIFVKHKMFHNRFWIVKQYLIQITLNNNFLKRLPRYINKSQIFTHVFFMNDGTHIDFKKVL